MAKLLAQNIGSNGITVVIEGVAPQTFHREHPLYNRVREALKEKDYDKVAQLVSMEDAVEEYSDGLVKVVDETLYYDDEELHDGLARRIVEMMREGDDFQPMVNFLKNLKANPSRKSQEQLYNFVDQENMPITPDGCVLGYKCVRSTYMDKYSNTVSNHVGAVIEMDRSKVDDDHNHHCSYGYHIGGLEYSGHGVGWYYNEGDKVMIVKFNPKDAVSVPNDHNFTKLRVCKYEVVAEWKGALKHTVQENYDDVVDDVDVNSFWDGDLITFTYQGEDRCGWVCGESQNGELVTISLHYDDVSFDYDVTEEQFRQFKKKKMENLKVLNTM